MKRFPLIICTLVICISIISCTEQTVPKLTYLDVKQCDSLEALGIINDYNYPIKPGSVEWESFTPEQQKMVLLIPADTLQIMCTHSLIETCFNYPLLWQIANYPAFSDWWSQILLSFNGVPEMLRRPETSEKMLEIYISFNAYPYPAQTSDMEKINIAARLTFMELFLAHQNVVSTFTPQQQILLGNKAKEIWETKNENISIPGALTPTYTCYLLGRIMYYNNYGDFIIKCNTNSDLDNFVKIGSYSEWYENSWQTIIQSYTEYVAYLQK